MTGERGCGLYEDVWSSREVCGCYTDELKLADSGEMYSRCDREVQDRSGTTPRISFELLVVCCDGRTNSGGWIGVSQDHDVCR